jgi:hypothetical protein
VELDIGKFIRIKASVDAALASADSATHAQGLSNAYGSYRTEILAMISGDGDLSAEFARLFPEHAFSGIADFGPDMAVNYGKAKTLLSGVSGWLDGIIQAAQADVQIRANAEAYAREKVKAERGVGFRGDETRGRS